MTFKSYFVPNWTMYKITNVGTKCSLQDTKWPKSVHEMTKMVWNYLGTIWPGTKQPVTVVKAGLCRTRLGTPKTGVLAMRLIFVVKKNMIRHYYRRDIILDNFVGGVIMQIRRFRRQWHGLEKQNLFLKW